MIAENSPQIIVDACTSAKSLGKDQYGVFTHDMSCVFKPTV